MVIICRVGGPAIAGSAMATSNSYFSSMVMAKKRKLAVLCSMGDVLCTILIILFAPGMTLAANPPLPSLPSAAGTTSSLPSSDTPSLISQALAAKEIRLYMQNVTTSVDAYLAENHEECINNPEKERNLTFNFESLDKILLNCTYLELKKGFEGRPNATLNLMWGICQKPELTKYFRVLSSSAITAPNEDGVNCNETSHPGICEPGFFGWVVPSQRNTSNTNDTRIPEREEADEDGRRALRCCPGFFCPAGYGCMIPCPIGSYCPHGVYNEETRRCSPYRYIPKGRTCGGADEWGVAGSNDQIFCEEGHYCDNTTSKTRCPAGYFCRKGSDTPRTCHLTECPEETTNQDLHVIGIAFIIILGAVLMTLYTCSNRALKSREKRKAAARQKAKEQTKERLFAMERWKKVKSAVMKGSSNFSRQFSRKTLSSRPLREDDQSMLGYEISGPVGDPPTTSRLGGPSMLRRLPEGEKPPPLWQPGRIPVGHSARERAHGVEEPSRAAAYLSTAVRATAPASTTAKDASFTDLYPEQEDLYKPLAPPPGPIPTNGPSDSVIVEVGKHSATDPDSRTRAYEYAYVHLIRQEMAAKGSLKDVIASAHELISGRVKQTIELKFENLGLTLKNSTRKKILQNVTGTLSPGRVTAVMGPSGAGKTTFLVAVAGKETYSDMTGHVYINGKEDPIQAYKKIIGFVPQDDIVHGNLSVEENLWFSANYRLPCDMAKRDKVLVVERTILALGLETIRGSRVGTVERRGISGGQRKRVNVGLEMVMEPSLLILDEPTSGLDSTSSRLVVQALRREAARGVNVGVVLHQPSFGIFCMFDDVMFLAKGGRTVYLGPVHEVEPYFNSLGFPVPDRINPPDHYMDVLEGLVKPANNPNFDKEKLPLLWINHKGLTVPEEEPSSSSLGSLSSKSEPAKGWRKGVEYIQNAFEDLWEDVTDAVHDFCDTLKDIFVKVEDKSGRKTPGFIDQYVLVLQRVAKQRFREHQLQVQDYIILLITGAALGFLSSPDDNRMGGGDAYINTILAVSLLAMIAALRTFGVEMLTFWRESASGIKRLSYFLAKDTVDHFNTFIKPIVYLSMFYFFNNPRSTFVDNYVVTLAMIYCTTGWAYVFSIVMPPAAAQLCSAVFTLVSTLLTKQRGKAGVINFLYNVSFARWSLEAYLVANARRYSGVWLLTRCATLKGLLFSINSFALCVSILFVFGLVGRLVAFTLLVMCKRDKQK